VLDRLPRVLLGLEGLAAACAAVALYFHLGFAWWLLLAFVLAPDLSAAGYIGGPRIGAAIYDAGHTYVLPLALTIGGLLTDTDVAMQVGLIWLTHIGVDRAAGYGLKYPTSFKDTHLQRV
jgi:hypothetical protein